MRSHSSTSLSDVRSSLTPAWLPTHTGAWPPSETRLLKLSVLTLNASSPLILTANGPDQKLAGPVVRFEPSGVRFGAPVTLSLPMLRDLDLGALVPAIHLFDPQASTWARKPYPSPTDAPTPPVDLQAGTVQCATLSFSSYAVLAVPPFQTPATSTPLPAPRSVGLDELEEEGAGGGDDTAAALAIAGVTPFSPSHHD